MELKKAIVENHECGVCGTDLALGDKMVKSAILTILKNEDPSKEMTWLKEG